MFSLSAVMRPGSRPGLYRYLTGFSFSYGTFE